MASEVDICNLALANLGDEASVASIDPPEGSAQADHCARFYPIARNALLEMHDWNFASTRVALAALTNTRTEWAYCYARPSNVISVRAVIPSDAGDDYVEAGAYVPQPFVCEVLTDGTPVIYTGQADAHARCTLLVTDTTKFSPLVVEALSHFLSSKLAGAVIKGSEGRQGAMAWLKFFTDVSLPQAKVSDANQRRVTPQTTGIHQVPWIVGR